MKKKTKNGLRPEYDFRQLKGGVKGKYATQFRSGTNLIHLDPDVAKVFENEKSVNQALRSLIKLTKAKAIHAH
jgi:hypothetical protein